MSETIYNWDQPFCCDPNATNFHVFENNTNVNFRVIKGTPGKSKSSGNPMMTIELECSKDGNTTIVKHYLVLTSNNDAKIWEYFKGVGISPNNGELFGDFFKRSISLTGECMLSKDAFESNSKDDKGNPIILFSNKIKKFYPSKDFYKSESKNESVAVANDSAVDDDIF